MKPMIFSLLVLAIMLCGLCLPADAETAFTGVVKSVKGGATLTRDGESTAVVAGMEIRTADIVKTARGGYVGLVFSDDTRISLGPDTELAIDDYLFKPLERQLSFVVRLFRGTLSFLSGQMTKLAPDSVQLVMPAATIGVRGTHVLIKVD